MAANSARPFPSQIVCAHPSDLPAPDAADDVQSLTRLLAAGDEAAFREFHQRYFDRLYRLLLVLTHGAEAEAMDALQDLLCRVARHVRTFDREEVLWCWLVRLARSAVLDAGRKRHRYWQLLNQYARAWLPIQVTTDSQQNQQLELLLLACVDALDPEERALIDGKYFSGRSIQELAQETGLTVRAIESRLHRIRKWLRKELIRRLNQDAA